MQQLPVRKIWGIGPKSAARLQERGIETCADLQALDRAELMHGFGSFGMELYKLCRGIDDRPVQPNRIRKSLSNERTFTKNLTSLSECREMLQQQHGDLIHDLEQHAPDRRIAKIFIKLKFDDFRRTTAEVKATQAQLKLFQQLLGEAWGRSGRDVRLLGLGVRFAQAGRGMEQLELGLCS